MNGEKRNVVVERRGERIRRPEFKQSKRWNHQAELAELKGKEINVIFFDGSCIKSKLIDADQYTIKIQQTIGDQTGTTIIYKHALCGFSPVE